MPATGYVDFVVGYLGWNYPICLEKIKIIRKLSLEKDEKTEIKLNLLKQNDFNFDFVMIIFIKIFKTY